ncbi:MAG: alpha/beta hydrolase fold domain-containing protein, partial [Clostridia bacterium]|nr:alpha/beta hydrolase fold domain-containing protein [Clostridia bacterium]
MKKKKSWDNKWYTEEFLKELKNTEYQKTDGNLKYTVKYPPDAVSKFGIDPRMLGGPIGKMSKGLQFIPDILFDNLHMKISRYSFKLFRKGCAKISYADCHISKIEIKNIRIPASDGYQIPVRIYQNDKCNITKALLVFIHGGAFVGGTLEPYDESLKMFVNKFSIKVLSIDYRLLPENLYPIPYTDCFDVIEHIYKNNDTYNIDKGKIFVCGDSAGGNIAQACSTKFKSTNIIRAQLLLYPTLNIFGYEDKYYKRGFNDYEFEPSQKRLSKGVIRQMQMLTNCNIKQIGIKSP